MLKTPTWAAGVSQRVAGGVLVAVGVFLLAAAFPAFLVKTYDAYVLGPNGSPNLKLLLAFSEHLILLCGTGLSIAYLMCRLSNDLTMRRK